MFVAVTNENKYSNKIIGCCITEYSSSTAEIINSPQAKTPLGDQILRLVCGRCHILGIRARFHCDGGDAKRRTFYKFCVAFLVPSQLFVRLCLSP
jgi:hypothetical protein